MRLVFSLILCLFSGVVYAQSKKLDSLKKADNLTAYIDEELVLVNNNPQSITNVLNNLWRKPKTAEERYTYLYLLCTQGYYQLQLGDILASINSYENAFAYYRKFQLSNFSAADYITKPLSNNYTRLGDYERAVTLQNKTINFLIATNANPNELAAMYGNIAISYRSMGNYSIATNEVIKGLNLVKNESETAFLLNNIRADILFDEGEYTSGLSIIEKNINQHKIINASNAYLQMSAFTTAGDLYMAMNNLTRADLFYNKALSIIYTYFKTSKIREKANLFTKKGNLKLLTKEPKEALNYYRQTLLTLNIIDKNGTIDNSKIYGENKLVDVFSQMAKANVMLGFKNEALINYKFALLAGDKIRNEFADNKTKERLQAQLKLITENAISLCHDLFITNKNRIYLVDVLAFIEKSKARTLLDQIIHHQQIVGNQKDPLFLKKSNLEKSIIYNEKQALEGSTNINSSNAMLKYDLALVEKQIKAKYPHYTQQEIPIEQVLKSLPDNDVITFFVGEKSIYVISIVNRQPQNLYVLKNAKEVKSIIKDFVVKYFQNGPMAMANTPQDFFRESNQVYENLLGKVKLHKGRDLIIIPDEILGYLSFDGLITTKTYTPNISNWPFLIKKQAITYAFSLSTLISNHPKNKLNKLYGLFIDYKDDENRTIEAVNVEANNISKITNADLIFNDEVNIKSFKKAFENSSVLHIGTHAYLSGKDLEPTLDLGKEKLFLFELSSKNQTPNLVFLGACRTADGALANGEGIISFSRGFSALGTPATIASLWNVNDAASAVITKDFYSQLLANKTAGTALRIAKLNWLNTPKPTDALYLPYYWDSFVFVGSDQKIKLQKPFHWTYYFGIIAILAIFSIYFLKKRIKS